jgi:calcium binding protein 39
MEKGTDQVPEPLSEVKKSVIQELLKLRSVANASVEQVPELTQTSPVGSGSHASVAASVAPNQTQNVDKGLSTTEVSTVQEAQERVAVALAALRSQLYGESRHDLPSPSLGSSSATAAETQRKQLQVEASTTLPGRADQVVGEHMPAEALLSVVYDADLLELLASSLPLMEFESRKDAVAIFNNILRRQAENRRIQVCAKVIESLLRDYRRPDVALTCGMMLREALRHEECVKILFNLDTFWIFFQLVQMNNFDVASDAFTTLRAALTRHKKLAADFMLEHFDRFFVTEYSNLLRSNNYVSKRQGLKLLSDLLLDRSNFYVMIRYVSLVENLKLVMILLLDPGKSIQLEAFHVFKLIVANPNKPEEVKRILARNRDKLLRYLAAFGNEAPAGNPTFTSEAFRDDLQLVMSEIQKLDADRASEPVPLPQS